MWQEHQPLHLDDYVVALIENELTFLVWVSQIGSNLRPSMELFLNILWLMIALGALAVWHLDWKRQQRPSPPKPLQEWTAFACALVFVFFAVSLSDDLHAAEILADDCATGRHHSLVWNCGHRAHQSATCAHAPSIAVFPHASSSVPVRVFAQIAPVALTFAPAADLDLAASRAPPVFHTTN